MLFVRLAKLPLNAYAVESLVEVSLQFRVFGARTVSPALCS